MTLYCATTNAGKLREFRAAGGPEFLIEPMPGLRAIDPPEESGLTFEENAIVKALYYASQAPKAPGTFLFAEDSGLEADDLCGEPGVYSARYAGPEATDEENNALLLDRMKNSIDRSARYVCAIALVRDGELLDTFRGTVEGAILAIPRGTGGFGYDPLFFYPPFGASFAEVAPEKKAQVSHRSRALAAMFESLRKLTP
ncbi:MAG: RdgB/HAM1 family non-canonical purine NTP pyrophosphatase [Bryobacteraceae bacterium]